MPRVRRQPKEAKTVTCYHCNYSTKIKSNLQKHITNVHVLKRGVPREKYFNCPMCTFSTTRIKMFDHYSNEHQVPIRKSCHNFLNLDDFRMWKVQVEKDETSRYIVLKGVSKLKSCNVWYYRCHRDGFFNSKGTGKRNLKLKGTNKINGCCPSEMKVMEDKATGKVQVHFVNTHVGHSQDLNRLPLMKEDKDRIAEKLALKVPLNKVLDEIQNSKSEEQKLERIHLVTRKDVLNIASSYKLKHTSSARRSSADGIGPLVESWVNQIEIQTDSVIRFYKPQGVVEPEEYPQLSRTDFVLIVYNDAQLEFLRSYGSDCLCFDRTHQRTQHDIELTTVMVIDEMRQAFPCAFMLSNRADAEVMSVLVSVIGQSLGCPMECNVFMSDVSDIYYNAWCASMPLPACRLFCSWHVDRAWRKYLMKIKNSEKRAYAYKIVRSLTLERNREYFGNSMSLALSDLKSDPELLPFGEYFEKEYSQNYMCWAHCFRLNSSFTTNTHLESMHKAVKNVFIQGRKAKRLDSSVTDLLKLIRDKVFDQSIVAHKGHLPVGLAFIRKKHDSNLIAMGSDVTVVNTDQGWRVLTSIHQTPNSEYYDVVSNNPSCPCHIRCEDCQICYHSFKCSCPISALEWNLCKHIHFVATSLHDIGNVGLKIEPVQQIPLPIHQAPQAVLHIPQPIQHHGPPQQVPQHLPQVQHPLRQVQHQQVQHAQQQVQHTAQQVQNTPQVQHPAQQVQHAAQVQHPAQQVQHAAQVQHTPQQVQHTPQQVQHTPQQVQHTPQQVQQTSQQVQHTPQQVQQHVSSQTFNNQSDDDDRSMEVLHICESNVARELEDLILKQLSKPKDRDSELKQAKNDALKLVQDIFDAVETRAQLEIFTNAILPVLPTITAMKYSGCTYK